jgi:hypothetical protein
MVQDQDRMNIEQTNSLKSTIKSIKQFNTDKMNKMQEEINSQRAMI